jgi:hypothetical protein
VGESAGGGDLGEQFAGEPHGGDFAVEVTGGEPGAKSFPAPLVQVVPPRQQQPADPLQRVVLAATVAELLVLEADEHASGDERSQLDATPET